MATARFGNLAFSAFGLGAVALSLLNIHVHRFPDATLYGYPGDFHGVHVHRNRHHRPHEEQQQNSQGQQADYILKMLFLMIGFFVILALILA
jgi:E3 ubiquitin-protein ligase RNF5